MWMNGFGGGGRVKIQLANSIVCISFSRDVVFSSDFSPFNCVRGIKFPQNKRMFIYIPLRFERASERASECVYMSLCAGVLRWLRAFGGTFYSLMDTANRDVKMYKNKQHIQQYPELDQWSVHFSLNVIFHLVCDLCVCCCHC